MSMVLEGTRVIDLTEWTYGSRGTGYLADIGAEVIKVENPRTGDPSRNLKNVRERSVRALPPCDWNYNFECNNRSKKSIAVDLRRREGREVIHRLVARADVFASTYAPERLLRLKLDYDTLRKVNAGLVYATSSGWGKNGPDKDREPIDALTQARAGLMCTLGEPGTPPVYTGTGEAVGAINLAYAIMVALFHRLRTGEGQQVEVSLFGANIAFENYMLQWFMASEGTDETRCQKTSRRDAGNPLYTTYRTKDKWVFMCMPQTDRYWGNVVKALGRPELEHDPRFDSHAKRCGESKDTIIKLFEDILPEKTAYEWFESQRGKLEMIVTPINNFADVANDPQAQVNEYIVDYQHPVHGPTKLLGFPVQMTKTPSRITAPAPALGQHTDQIMADLGYSKKHIRDLREARVIV